MVCLIVSGLFCIRVIGMGVVHAVKKMRTAVRFVRDVCRLVWNRLEGIPVRQAGNAQIAC